MFGSDSSKLFSIGMAAQRVGVMVGRFRSHVDDAGIVPPLVLDEVPYFSEDQVMRVEADLIAGVSYVATLHSPLADLSPERRAEIRDAIQKLRARRAHGDAYGTRSLMSR